MQQCQVDYLGWSHAAPTAPIPLLVSIQSTFGDRSQLASNITQYHTDSHVSEEHLSLPSVIQTQLGFCHQCSSEPGLLNSWSWLTCSWHGDQANQPGAVIGWQSLVGSMHGTENLTGPIPLPCLPHGPPADQKGWPKPLRESKASTPPGTKFSCRAWMSTPSGSTSKSIITLPAFPD